jgi:heme/copper-type cytochrome/quinol oxidase subunit 4
MFIGHYGVSFAAKAYRASIPLWILFLAVQLVDVFWAVLVLLGIEKVRIVPGITATNPLDLYYMPYTHSLVMSLVWAGAAALVYRMLPRLNGWGSAAIVGLAVFSHWLFDLLVHRPDLPLYDNSAKMGLGLWNYPVIAFALEVALLAIGMFLYARNTRPTRRGGGAGLIVFGLLMAAVQLTVFFGSPPKSDTEVAISALVAYVLFAAVAFWLERRRAPKS